MTTNPINNDKETQSCEVEMGSIGASKQEVFLKPNELTDSSKAFDPSPGSNNPAEKLISKKRKFRILLAILFFNSLNFVSCILSLLDYFSAADNTCSVWSGTTSGTCNFQYCEPELSTEFVELTLIIPPQPRCYLMGAPIPVTCKVWATDSEHGGTGCYGRSVKISSTTVETPVYNCAVYDPYTGGFTYDHYAIPEDFQFDCNTPKLVPLKIYVDFTIYCFVAGVLLMLLTVVESYYHYKMNKVSPVKYFWVNMCTNTLAMVINGLIMIYILTHEEDVGDDYVTLVVFRVVAMVMILIEMLSFLLVSHGFNHAIISFFTADYHKYFSGEVSND